MSDHPTLDFGLWTLDSKNSPVNCLAIEFPSDDERRKYFIEKLREFLADPEFCKFHNGLDKD